MSTSDLQHGGDLDAARRLFAGAPAPWIDLSTGINPRHFPIGALPAEVWRRLPDKGLLADAEAAARRSFRAPAAAEVVAGPGTQAFIQALPKVLAAQRVAVLGFGYQEHPAIWRAAGSEVTVVERLEDLLDADVAVVINPNNPDGRLIEPSGLVALARRLTARGSRLVVDEAFVDVMPDHSLVPYLEGVGAVVLRSFGKFFGLAGVRLGFAVTDPVLAARLRVALGPWPVAGPALELGRRALADEGWQTAERARLQADATRLDQLLTAAALRVAGGTALFRLVEDEQAQDWFARLGYAGILVRRFREKPAWLRFGLPGDEEAWRRLKAALANSR